MALDLSKFEDVCARCQRPVLNTDECSGCPVCGQYTHDVCGPVHWDRWSRGPGPYMGVITRRGDHP